ncbi:hypothetical protein [Rathayibacter sp. AY1A3]|uniref:hypothetical protein n=1 Tax=Rathayibacter sp. AY1A3 TaxID=2080521 RepID=UPI0011B0E40F|nr:hypothetical protein [Rathayibacter sp. AY1A3]
MDGFWDLVKDVLGLTPGEFADWVSGIGTLLAFGLGLKILRNDRRREQRQQANNLITSISTQADGTRWRYIFTVYNVGNTPVFALGFMNKPYSIRRLEQQILYNGDSIIPPGASTEVELLSPMDPKKTKLYAHFLDSNNQVWWRREGTDRKYLTWRVKWWEFERILQSWRWTIYKLFTGKNLAAREE